MWDAGNGKSLSLHPASSIANNAISTKEPELT